MSLAAFWKRRSTAQFQEPKSHHDKALNLLIATNDELDTIGERFGIERKHEMLWMEDDRGLRLRIMRVIQKILNDFTNDWDGTMLPDERYHALNLVARSLGAPRTSRQLMPNEVGRLIETDGELHKRLCGIAFDWLIQHVHER